ncbi:MAG: hypothetical protein LBQ51_04155 [Desulfovibrio sp.]|jgi:hypothetical protein|nr:hypothetical protein [Desulfovibrio sp.]
MYDVELLKDAPDGASRLNVVLPALGRDMAFGGVASALELARNLSAHYAVCRFISLFEEETSVAPPAAPEQRQGRFAHLENSAGRTELFFAASGERLPCHEKDLFLITYHAGFSFWEKLHKARSGLGLAPLPFYYFIQDWEPGFAPFGQKHALALKSYSFGDLTRAVINSAELAEHIKANGCRFSEEYLLKPSMNRDMAAFLRQSAFMLPAKEGERMILLFYGRPGLPRNCFEVGVETLKLFFAGLPRAGRDKFAALSVGLPHEDIPLADGALLKSLGRLPIEEYIALLLKAHVGLSLMISPHPSYPPMEMALFGLATVTTDYGAKKMQGVHPLLASARWPEPEELLGLLRRAVITASKLKNRAQRAVLPASMSGLDWAENFASLRIRPIVP